MDICHQITCCSSLWTAMSYFIIKVHTALSRTLAYRFYTSRYREFINFNLQMNKQKVKRWAGGPRSCIGWLSTETCMFQVPTDQSLASLPLPLRNPKSAPYRHTYRLPSLFVCVLDLMTRLLVFKWLLDHRLSTNSPMPPVFLPCAIFFSLVFDFPVYELLPTTF